MNNSKIATDVLTLRPEAEVDRNPYLRTREAELVRLIEAVKEVEASKAWSTLKELVFSIEVEKLESQLKTEAEKDNPNPLSLRFVSGKMAWATKYADLSRLATVFRLELTNVRKNLHGQENN